MAKKWQDIKKRHATIKEIAESRTWAKQKVIELNLRAVRELMGKSQTELSQATGTAQGELSKIERRDDHLISTLRRYIEALGGELEVVARFGDKSIKLHGV